MRIIRPWGSLKSFVTAVVFLLALESLISAEMTVMSLQERMMQSDAVVVGEIIESRNTGKETEMGTEHWLATCRVERYITNKTHDPETEVLKRVNTIRIRFVQIPRQTPARLKLSKGKKYLLFLRDRGSQYQGEVAYEMITPYHGAFEAGQEYFVQDEQSPEYPKAVKMSFEEIVQRVTQKNPAPEPSQALTLFIHSDKKVYEPGEEIILSLRFKNTGNKSLWLFSKMLPNADLKLAVYRMDGDNRVDISPPIKIDILRQIAADTDFKELLPQEVFSMQISLKDFQRELTLQEGSYEISLELNLPSYIFSHVSLTPWTGSIQSNTITIEVRGKDKKGADIRGQLDAATGYWYAYFREKMLGEGRALRNVHAEGEWTVFETFSHHGWGHGRVLTRFLDAQEAKIEGTQLTLNWVKAFLRSSIPSEVEEGIREIGTPTGMNLKDNACSSPEKCLKWIENNEDYFFWDEEKSILNIAEQRRMANFGRAVRGMGLSIKADKTIYSQNEPIVLTVKLENILPASGILCAVFPVNARMLIYTEILLDVRNEAGGYVRFPAPAPPRNLTVEDFKALDGGQFIESQEDLASQLYEKPLAPGRYHIQATYQNYELGKELSVPASCAGSSVLLESGPAWAGRIFSNTVTIEVKNRPTDQTSCEAQGGRWGRFGLMEKEQCNRPTTDAGKECSDHSECESDCVTEDAVPAGTEVTGKCFEWTVTLGRCLNGVKDGKAQGVICAD